jgi:hypothetical protein
MRRAGKGTIGLIGAGIGNAASVGMLRHQMAASAADPADLNTLQKMREKAHVPVHDAPHGVNAFIAPAHVAGRDIAQEELQRLGMGHVKLGPEGAVLLGKGTASPGVLAHELGHADIHKMPVGRRMQGLLALNASARSGQIGRVSGALSGLSDNETVQNLGLAAPAIASAPLLAAEGLASIKGIKHMRGAGAKPAQMWRMAKTLAPAWGSYATHTGLGVANAAIAQGLTGAVRKNFSAPPIPVQETA